jgi:hypothetical protein
LFVGDDLLHATSQQLSQLQQHTALPRATRTATDAAAMSQLSDGSIASQSKLEEAHGEELNDNTM